MRALVLIAGAALALAAAPAIARDDHGERCDDHDRYENPYSLASIHRERARKELASDIAKAERIERQKERASRVRDRDDQADEESDEDDPDDR
jgi:hypothetical protein